MINYKNSEDCWTDVSKTGDRDRNSDIWFLKNLIPGE
jgi:hypothetical protein